MYTEEEVLSGRVGKKSHLTKLIVKVPEQERKQLMDVQTTQTRQRLQDFLHQIDQQKRESRSGSRRGTKSQRCGGGGLRLGSNGSTSISGDMNSLGGAKSYKLEPRHFKSKEGAVWLNMFESLSTVHCT